MLARMAVTVIIDGSIYRCTELLFGEEALPLALPNLFHHY
jgi:hypothetical protein